MTTPHPNLPEIGVLVIGGGVVGVATAGYLAKEGAEVGFVGGTTANAGSPSGSADHGHAGWSEKK